jgi:hypothetical protein
VFTLKAKDRAPHVLADILKGITKEFYFQKEKGSGAQEYVHYQGCFSLLTSKQMLSTVKNLMGFNDVHLETCKDWPAAKAYSMKDETRLEGPWSHKGPKLNPKYQLARGAFYDWQATVEGWLKEEPDDRHIHWIYDKVGGNGKSKLVNYVTDNYSACCFNNGKESDIAYAYDSQPIVLFDLPRAKKHVNYVTMEDLKNGRLFSGKYESTTKRFNPPHVVVFANWLPDFSEMSMDRWCVYKLEKKKMIREYEFTIKGEFGAPDKTVSLPH